MVSTRAVDQTACVLATGPGAARGLINLVLPERGREEGRRGMYTVGLLYVLQCAGPWHALLLQLCDWKLN